MPAPLEIAVAVLIAVVWPAWEHFVAWPRFVKRIQGGAPDGRVSGYRMTVVTQWLIATIAGIAAWLSHRPPASLGLIVRPVVALYVELAVFTALAVLLGRQIAKVRSSAKARESVRKQLARSQGLDVFPPRTATEFRMFLAVSVTAGVCEEFLFRGFLIATLAGFMPAWLAAVVAAVFFGFGHAYQGGKGVAGIAALGLIMGLLYVWAGSLLPVILIHIALDAGNGATTYFALREEAEA